MAGQYGGQQIVIIDPSKERTRGRDALSMNIDAAKAVSNIVKTTLGPKGMDKMLVNQIGDIVLTNDGATILKEMAIEHPTAKMIVEVARTQEKIAGDGTTSAVILAGTLLENARDLVDIGVHPAIIVKGYRLAAQKAISLFEDFAISVTADDKEILNKIAKTSITGKAIEAHGDFLSSICVDAVLAIRGNGSINIDDNILIIQDSGSKIDETELVEGVVLNKWRLLQNMPSRIENAKIALIDTPLDLGKTFNKSKVQIQSADDMIAFVEQEESYFKNMVDAIVKSGANVVLCSKNIDDPALHYLQKNNIYATRRVKDNEMKNISRATGARIIRNVHEIEANDLGSAGLVEQIGASEVGKTYIKECTNAKSVTIIVRGATDHVTDNIERSLDDALRVVKNVIEDGTIVPGGGASEIDVALGLRAYAASVGGREQMAISAFADAIEAIPKALATNAGYDSIDMILDMRAKHSNMKNAGLNVFTGEIEDMLENGIVDSLRVKTQAIKSASEAATMVLRIDDVLRAQRQDMQDVKREHNIHNYDGMSAPLLENRR
ncbi:MAG: thermosome subunit alpha [Methanosarcinaceae archaeon]|nr:TCP-1/cpn60 chaperonin family protein [Methanosarcinaceae archaeon]MDF1534045.1 thermosome subunit alpha [Methanosarcinaceae archaeon]